MESPGTVVAGEREHPLRHALTIGRGIAVGSATLVFSWPADREDPERTDPHDQIPALAAALSPLQRLVVQALCGAWVTDASVDVLPGLEELRVDTWLVDPELTDGPDGTDKIEGELDVVGVANGLIDLAGSLTGTDRVDKKSGRQLREAVESTEFELLTGEDDRLLRKLALGVELAADVPEDLREALGDVVGAGFSFLLELEKPNEPVDLALP